jgi:hypothetical protein
VEALLVSALRTVPGFGESLFGYESGLFYTPGRPRYDEADIVGWAGDVVVECEVKPRAAVNYRAGAAWQLDAYVKAAENATFFLLTVPSRAAELECLRPPVQHPGRWKLIFPGDVVDALEQAAGSWTPKLGDAERVALAAARLEFG